MNNVKESIVCTFLEIKEELDDYSIFKAKMNAIDFLLRKFYKLFGKYINSNRINYNYIAYTFNKVYFWKNLLKNLIFFDEYYYLIDNSILDVGCGAAPASISIAKLMKNKGTNNLSFTLIDKSKIQLSIARDIAQIMSINIKEYIENSFEIHNKRYNELVIFSYFFCEQKNDFLITLFNNRKNFNGGFIFIDYIENILKIERYFREHGDNGIKCISLNYSVPSVLTKFIYDTEVNVHGCFYRS